MIFLIIIFALVLIIVSSLFAPVTLTVNLQSRKKVKVRYLCFSFNLSKGEKPSRGEKTGRGRKKPGGTAGLLNTIKQRFAGENLPDTVSKVCDALKSLAAAAGKILNRSVMTRFELYMAVTGKDAADAAVSCGRVCGIFYPFMAVARESVNFKSEHTRIVCDYFNSRPTVRFFCRWHIRPAFVIKPLLSFVVSLIKGDTPGRDITAGLRRAAQNSARSG